MIDKQGRLKIFKWKVNLIDFLALLFLVFFVIIPTGYFIYKCRTHPQTKIHALNTQAKKNFELQSLSLYHAAQKRQIKDFLEEYPRFRHYFKENTDYEKQLEFMAAKDEIIAIRRSKKIYEELEELKAKLNKD